jgi:hypothetical protein
MKRLILITCIIFLIISCKKEPLVYPIDTYKIQSPTFISDSGISMWGKFLLIDGTMYVNNNETGEKTSYKHFDINKSRSSLRWGGSMYDIEKIVKDTTTYSIYAPIKIPGYGNFILNDDTSKHYSIYHSDNYQTIIEDPTHKQSNLGGSSRPFSGYTLNKKDKIIVIHIEEIEGSINGYNCKYWSELTFRKIESF